MGKQNLEMKQMFYHLNFFPNQRSIWGIFKKHHVDLAAFKQLLFQKVRPFLGEVSSIKCAQEILDEYFFDIKAWY